jgi:hypothetical protein
MSLTQGPNFPTAATGSTNTIGGGTVAWTNPTNIEANDGSTATCLPGVAITDDLRGGVFNFSIPSTATIVGITLEVNGNAFVNGIEAFHTVVMEGGGGASANRAAGALANTASTFTFGGPTDLWGTTWTPAQVNAGSFVGNISFQSTAGGPGTVSVDWMRVTVNYNADANVNATGVSATGSIGTAAASGTAVKAVTGVSATGAVGTVVPAISKTVVGFSSTASLGTATFTGTATVAVTGVSSTTHLGSAIATISVPVSGVSASGSIGSVTTNGTANINVVGLASTASLGFVRIDAVVSVSGLHATASLGQVTDKLFAVPSGVSSITHLGTVSVEVRSRMPVVVWIN